MRIECVGSFDSQNIDECFELENAALKIGAAANGGIKFSALGVSRLHALISEKDGSLSITDAGSLNGTIVNGTTIKSATPLAHGDMLQIGVKKILVSMENNVCRLEFQAVDALPRKKTAQMKKPEPHYEKFAPEDEELSTAMTVIADANIRELIRKGRLEQVQKICDENARTTSSIKITLAEGAEVGKYRIIHKIGKGGMGEIYLAKHKTLGTYRALKILPKRLQEDNSQFFERFLREARLASEIRHPNVVNVMDVENDDENGISYIVMEYIDGGSLRRILKSTKHLTEEQTVVIVRATATALAAAQAKNIVHRDIKPDNIMFTKSGDVKLADLGIAKNDDDDVSITKSNVMIGTPAYLSPEQVQDAKNVDTRADIYSLGATYYEMLTGHPPYTGKTTYDILRKLFSDPVPDPREINPEISSASAGTVMKMLAKEPSERFQTPNELLDAMDEIFPKHSAAEEAEIVRGAIAGLCEAKEEFSNIVAGNTMKNRVKRRKKLALVSLGVMSLGIIILSFAYLLKNEIPWDLLSIQGVQSILPIFNEGEEHFAISVNAEPGTILYLTMPDMTVKETSVSSTGGAILHSLNAGTYRLRAEKDGMATYNSRIMLPGITRITIRPKSAEKKNAVEAYSLDTETPDTEKGKGEFLLLLEGSAQAIQYAVAGDSKIRIGQEEWKKITTTYHTQTLPPGEHILSIRLDGMTPFSDCVFNVEDGRLSTLTVKIEPEDVPLTIICNAPDASFNIGGSKYPCGTYAGLKAFMFYNITVEAAGYRTETFQIQTEKPGKTTNMNVELIKNDTKKAPGEMR